MSLPFEYINQYILFTAIRNCHLHLHNKIRGATASLLNRFLQLHLIQNRARSTFHCWKNILSGYPSSLSASRRNADCKGRAEDDSKYIPFLRRTPYELCWEYFSATTRIRRNYIWSNITFSNWHITRINNVEQRGPWHCFCESDETVCLWHFRNPQTDITGAYKLQSSCKAKNTLQPHSLSLLPLP